MRSVSKSEFARIAGVTPAAVTKACKTSLAGALQGKRVDLDHPSAAAYLRSKGVNPTTVGHGAASRRESAPSDRPRPPDPEPPRVPEAPVETSGEGSIALPREVTWEEVWQFSEHRFRDVAERFGTAPVFKDWMDVLKKIQDTREKYIKNEEAEGRLIERELVQIHVFGLFRGLTRRLLRDAPRTLADEIYKMALSGQPIEEAEKAIRDGLGSQILSAKTKVASVLGGEGPAQEDDE